MKQRFAFVTLSAAAALGSPALAAEPLAEFDGVLEGPVRDVIRDAIGSAEEAPGSVVDARQRGERARDRAQAALRSEGYYAARIEIVMERGDPPRARLEIEPGERFVLGAVTFDLGEVITAEARAAAEEAAGLSAGAPARAEDVIAAEARAVSALIAAGYPDARALDRTVRVDHARGEMDVGYSINPGRAAVLGELRLSGTAYLRSGYVEHLAPYQPGDTYTRAPLDALARRLRGAEAFETVSVRLAPSEGPARGPDPRAPERRDIIVEVDQGDRHTVRLGASYSSSEGGGVEAEWLRRNMFGGGEGLTISAALRTIDRRLDAELRMPHWRVPNRTLRLSAGVIDEETDAFNRRAFETGATVEARLTPRLGGSIGANATYERVEDDEGTQNFALLGASGAINWDGSDDPLDPTRGLRAAVSTRPTIGYGDDAVGYVVVDGAVSAYQKLDSEGRLVAAVRARGASVLGPSLGELPADERFYAGGGGSVRGYDYQAISPRNEDGEVIGGRSLAEVSAELRWRGEGRWGYAAFIDGGAAWSELDPELSEFRWGIGVGARYYTAFGPIRVDVAAPLDKRDGESPAQLYLSIGQAF
ncbi:MAG: autotransporter assembly complex family protein [Maricaulaceae bacterium]|jgi:translocation and assembly module TamA